MLYKILESRSSADNLLTTLIYFTFLDNGELFAGTGRMKFSKARQCDE